MQSNWEAGLEAGRKAGLEAGRKAGLEYGENRVNRLIQLLIANSRGEEIERAVSDKAYQDELFLEFKL